MSTVTSGNISAGKAGRHPFTGEGGAAAQIHTSHRPAHFHLIDIRPIDVELERIGGRRNLFLSPTKSRRGSKPKLRRSAGILQWVLADPYAE